LGTRIQSQILNACSSTFLLKSAAKPHTIERLSCEYYSLYCKKALTTQIYEKFLLFIFSPVYYLKFKVLKYSGFVD